VEIYLLVLHFAAVALVQFFSSLLCSSFLSQQAIDAVRVFFSCFLKNWMVMMFICLVGVDGCWN
jgi:hypothetical protein